MVRTSTQPSHHLGIVPSLILLAFFAITRVMNWAVIKRLWILILTPLSWINCPGRWLSCLMHYCPGWKAAIPWIPMVTLFLSRLTRHTRTTRHLVWPGTGYGAETGDSLFCWGDPHWSHCRQWWCRQQQMPRTRHHGGTHTVSRRRNMNKKKRQLTWHTEKRCLLWKIINCQPFIRYRIQVPTVVLSSLWYSVTENNLILV